MEILHSDEAKDYIKNPAYSRPSNNWKTFNIIWALTIISFITVNYFFFGIFNFTFIILAFFVPFLIKNLLAKSLEIYFRNQYSIKESEFENESAKALQSVKKTSDQQALLKTVIDSTKEGIIITTTNGIVTFVNKTSLLLLKSTESLLIGKFIDQVLPKEKQLIKSNNFLINLTSLMDETKIISAEFYDLKNHEGQIIGKTYFFNDVTDKNAFEQMKLDFVAITAHQLRTPLTAIRGYLQFLEDAFKQKKIILGGDEQMFLERSIVSSERLASLIENLLYISKIEKGALKVDFKLVFIKDVLQGVVNDNLDNAKQKNITLNLEFNKGIDPKIQGNSDLLEMAISNIVQNAINYNNPGGWVSIQVSQEQNELILHISDSGRGIPSKAIPYLFTKFFRVSKSYLQLSNGMGLGLYITKAIIDAHKGKIWVNSIEKKGSTFSVSLPLYLEKSQSFSQPRTQAVHFA